MEKVVESYRDFWIIQMKTNVLVSVQKDGQCRRHTLVLYIVVNN